MRFNSGNYFNRIAEIWIEFVEKQQKLKILIIDDILNLELLQQLTLVTGKLSELEEMAIYWEKDFGHNEIAGLMASGRKLRKVVLFSLTERMCNELRTLTDSQWQYEGRTRRYEAYSTEEVMFKRNQNSF